jgi:hypothetical protein
MILSNCTLVGPDCPFDESAYFSNYGYVPTLWVNDFFMAVGLVALVAHLVQAIRFRTIGFGIAMLWNNLLLILGYVGRVWTSDNIYSQPAFEMGTVCLTIAPLFLSTAIYLCLPRLILIKGKEYSRFSARYYTRVFCTSSFISLFLESLGSGLTSTALRETKYRSSGYDVTIVGLVIQVLTLTIFALSTVDYFLRTKRGRATITEPIEATNNPIKSVGFFTALGLSFLCVYIRCIFRLAELGSGWGSAIMRNEKIFIGLEGVTICIAVAALTFFHPGFCFKLGSVQRGEKKRDRLPIL